MKLNRNEKNAFEAIWHLVRLKKLKITATSLKNALLNHYDFPALDSLSDVLNNFNVPNLAIRITPEQLHEIPLPAVAHIGGNQGAFITITKIADNTIEWINNEEGIKKETISDFIQKWRGITFLIEPDKNSEEENYTQKRKSEIIENLRLPFIILGLILCSGLFIDWSIKQYATNGNLQLYSLLLTKTIGLIISAILIWYNIDSENAFLKRVCQINDKTSCKNILNSKAANLFGIISWAEIGFFYFLLGFISLFFLRNESFIFLGTLGLLALPYTLWSIYYQSVVAKSWCVFCLAIQLLLWIEAIIFYKIGYVNPFSVSIIGISNWEFVVMSFLFFITLWMSIKKSLINSLKTDILSRELQKLKFNPNYLQSLTDTEAFLPPIFNGMRTPHLGRPSADNNITIILNPTCSSCKQAYLATKKLIETNDNIKCHIILASPLTLNNITGLVSCQILSKQSEKDILNALDEWFADEIKNNQKWIKHAKTEEDYTEGLRQLGLHMRWINLAQVKEAPTIFFNNIEVPKYYVGQEIIRLINELSK